MSAAAGNGACSSGITHIDIVTDDTGAGTMALPTQGFVIEYAVQHAYLIMNAGGGGVIGGVLPTESLVAATDKAAGCLASNLCSGPSLDNVNAQLRQASDTTVDGTSAPGQACDAISFGLTFTGSTAFNGMFPAVTSCCDSGT
jgi:hypothetical protein